MLNIRRVNFGVWSLPFFSEIDIQLTLSFWSIFINTVYYTFWTGIVAIYITTFQILSRISHNKINTIYKAIFPCGFVPLTPYLKKKCIWSEDKRNVCFKTLLNLYLYGLPAKSKVASSKFYYSEMFFFILQAILANVMTTELDNQALN